MDLTITNPAASSHISLLSVLARLGSAAVTRERAKVAKYAELARTNGFRLKAFGLDMYGAWGPEAAALALVLVSLLPR